MDDEKLKTKRSANFTLNEKLHLINIVANSHAHIIEDKKTDRSSVALNITWKKIESDFNACSPNNIYRPAETLKKFYENRKKDIRKQVAEEKKQRMLTGGGSMPVFKKDYADELLKSIMNEKTISGNTNFFDSDNVPGCNGQVIIESPSTENDIEYEFIIDEGGNEDSTEWESEEQNSKDNNSQCVSQQNHEASIKQTTTRWKYYTLYNLKLPMNSVLKNTGNTSGTVDNPKVVRVSTVNKENEESVANLGTGPGADSSSTPVSHKRKQSVASNRRKPTATIRTLTSSDIGAKYSMLLDQRITLVNNQIKCLQEEREFKKEEQKLKLELLKIEISCKKSFLKQNYQ